MQTIQIASRKPEFFADLSQLPEGVELEFVPDQDRPFMTEAVVSALITIPVSVATNLVSSWIYDRWSKTHKPSEPIHLNREIVIEVTIERITEIASHEHS